jgi:hypothetical protein
MRAWDVPLARPVLRTSPTTSLVPSAASLTAELACGLGTEWARAALHPSPWWPEPDQDDLCQRTVSSSNLRRAEVADLFAIHDGRLSVEIAEGARIVLFALLANPPPSYGTSASSLDHRRSTPSGA